MALATGPIGSVLDLKNRSTKPFNIPHYSFRPLKDARIGLRSRNDVFQNRAGKSDDGLDVAVFRFTLGIDGFDDSLIPRIVGCMAGIFLIVNHWATKDAVAASQWRSELLGLLLCGACVAAPSIEKRLEELQPGRGRRAAAAMQGTQQGFIYDSAMDLQTKQELAWASINLLKNTNSSSVFVFHKSKALLARGLIPESLIKNEKPLDELSKDLSFILPRLSDTMPPLAEDQALKIISSQSNLKSIFGSACFMVPGVKSVLLQELLSRGEDSSCSGGWLIILSDEQRAWSPREQAWIASIGDKLSSSLH